VSLHILELVSLVTTAAGLRLLTTQIGSSLHGIPLLVKDNIAAKDEGLDVSAGSFALLGAKPVNESSVIEKLREAGVVVLGKTNMSEWANFRGLGISAGWSPRGGQTLGVYYPDSSPAGSSSGSAVAVALGLAVAALGTEVRLLLEGLITWR
jgi:amidase